MNVTSEMVGNINVIAVYGELDASNVNDFKNFVLPLLASPIKLIIDLSHTQFVDSSGLGAMISCQRHAAAAGGKLKLCCMSKPVRAAFELVRLQFIFDIKETREEAIHEFSEADKV